jgi:uncharacterized membrane protein YvlD (DUF360 family)
VQIARQSESKTTVNNVQKYSKKLLTQHPLFEIVTTHTVQQNNKMRTKTLVLTAALVAAGALSSVAQNVYSVNVVGYINLTIQPGLNLISVPLSAATTDINTVLTNQSPLLDASSLVYTWNSAGQSFNQAAAAGGDGQWYLGDYSDFSHIQLTPGQGFFLRNGGAASTLTLVGTVPQGTNNVTEAAALSFLGDPAPVQQEIVTNGFPVVTGSFLYTWNTAGQHYDQAINGVSAADNSTPNPAFYNGDFSQVITFTPAPGQGFVYYNFGSSATWHRSFTVQ